MAKSTKKKTQTIVAEPAPVSTRISASDIEHGMLKRNDEIEQDDEPDYKGSLKFPAPGSYWLEGFMKKDNTGAPYMSLKIKEQEKPDVNPANDDRGVLFRNKRKRLKTHADYNGTVHSSSAGEFGLAAVIETSKGGENYMRIDVLSGGDEVVEESDMPF